MSNNINELRTLLFDTLRDLKSGKLDIEKARAISDIGQTIINSAKVEVDYVKATGGKGSGFIDGAQIGESIATRTQHGVKLVENGVTRHVMK